jgi:hypothetical protein
MEEHRNGKGRRRGLVAAVLSAAAVAVALPVAGALANDGTGDSSTAGSLPVQTQDRPAPRDDSPPRHDGDCPEKDGARGSGSDASVEL